MTKPTHMTHARRAQLETVLRAEGPGRALPLWTFSDPEFWRWERERTFGVDFVAVGSASALAKPGDYLTTVIDGEPVIVVRTDAGELVAVSNVCRHRGTLLLEGSGNAQRIRCPYHRWTYGLDGRFKAAPYDDACADSTGRAEERSLPHFEVEVWNGVVFVALGNATPSLTERLRGLDAHLGELAAGNLVSWPGGDSAPELWQANWKLVFENASESYHLFAVHPKTLEQVSPTRGAYYVAGNERWSITRGSTTGGGEYTVLALPPSFVGIFDGFGMMWLGIAPESESSTHLFGGYSTVAAALEMQDSGQDEAAQWAREFMEEDRVVMERTQRGLTASRTEVGPLLEVERTLGDFHRYLLSRLSLSEP